MKADKDMTDDLRAVCSRWLAAQYQREKTSNDAQDDVESLMRLCRQQQAIVARRDEAVISEVHRIRNNGSLMTDFGRGVIAACKDIENFLVRLRGGG